MGYVECKYHGGKVTAFVSKYHADKANRNEKCLNSEVIKVKVKDKAGLVNGIYTVDPKLLNEIGINSSEIDFQRNRKKVEAMLNALSPVCPMCLKNYLKND